LFLKNNIFKNLITNIMQKVFRRSTGWREKFHKKLVDSRWYFTECSTSILILKNKVSPNKKMKTLPFISRDRFPLASSMALRAGRGFQAARFLRAVGHPFSLRLPSNHSFLLP
jgi:hypothetical protein